MSRKYIKSLKNHFINEAGEEESQKSYNDVITDLYSDAKRVSAGVAITCKGMILLVRATNWDEWSIPKGQLDKGEEAHPVDAALRELKEETGLRINKDLITNPEAPEKIYYESTMGGRKKLLIYKCPINDWSQIGLEGPYIPYDDLQTEEVDVGIFLTKMQASYVFDERQRPILDLVF